jgi:hypothetical protein
MKSEYNNQDEVNESFKKFNRWVFTWALVAVLSIAAIATLAWYCIFGYTPTNTKPPEQSTVDTTLIDTTTKPTFSTGTARFHKRREQHEKAKAAQDTVQDVRFVDDWESETVIK